MHLAPSVVFVSAHERSLIHFARDGCQTSITELEQRRIRLITAGANIFVAFDIEDLANGGTGARALSAIEDIVVDQTYAPNSIVAELIRRLMLPQPPFVSG